MSVCVCVKMAINVTKRKQWQQQQQQQRQQSRSQATFGAIYPRASLAISSTILNTENNHWLCTRHQITNTQRGPQLLLMHKMSDAHTNFTVRGFYFPFSFLSLSLSLSLSLFRLFYGLLKAAFLYISRAPHK